MTRTGTILKAMQAVLVVTVLTPATVFAGSLSHLTAQTQDQPASGGVRHANRGLILTPAEAATNTKVVPQVEIPALPPRHDEVGEATGNSYSTAAAPVATNSTAQTSSIVTLPAPAQPAADAPASATNTAGDAVAPTQTTPPAPATATVQTPAAAIPAATAASASAATTPANAAPRKTAQLSHQRRSRHHSDDSFNVGGFNVSSGHIERQATKFFNRSDVKSILAQYGLN